MNFQQILSCLTSIFTFFWYLWILTPPSNLFWPFLAVSQGSTLNCTWGTYIGHNQCWESKFGNIHHHNSNFPILLSSGLLAAFLVSEFKLNTFSIVVGPNDPIEAKKYKNFIPLWPWPLMRPLKIKMAFLAFLYLFGVP